MASPRPARQPLIERTPQCDGSRARCANNGAEANGGKNEQRERGDAAAPFPLRQPRTNPPCGGNITVERPRGRRVFLRFNGGRFHHIRYVVGGIEVVLRARWKKIQSNQNG